MVYFVATIRNIDPKYGTMGTRTVGYFEELDTAKKCVKEEWGLIAEDGYYKYAVIEGVEPGLYRSSDPAVKPIFYKWVNGKYRKIAKPAALKHLVGFTIG